MGSREASGLVGEATMTEATNIPEVSTLPGVNVLLMGPAGTGKTHAIGTLVE